MKKKAIVVTVILLLAAGAVIFALDAFRVLPHRQFTGEHFQIPQYRSAVDRDGDGIDDQTDILQSVREYLATNPKYRSEYYATGYPTGKYGVCTDVVAFGLKGAGYDLMALVNEHIRANPSLYNIDTVDKNIDFRRVRNLRVYFENTAISLTTDIRQIEEWQGGDIVIFENHIGVVSDKRNRKGIPFLIHHGNPAQLRYEEDVLSSYRGKIVGHYRIS